MGCLMEGGNWCRRTLSVEFREMEAKVECDIGDDIVMMLSIVGQLSIQPGEERQSVCYLVDGTPYLMFRGSNQRCGSV